ncbi:MAG TPA: hypothetical protein VEK57_08650 [Thermoanaerobaculia bacterium]|nr:hypothetical protein [Thermoanaerobaculia bacterium]
MEKRGSSRWSKRTAAEIALLLLLLAAVAAAYADATKLSWTYDDAFLLHVVSVHDARGYFDSQQFWRSMPAQMFVPLLLVWYEAGSRVSELEDARGFYVLTIALLLAALAVSYVALRMWLGAAESLAAVAMIGLGPLVVSVVTQLMATHYLIALGMAAGAVALYTWGISGEMQNAKCKMQNGKRASATPSFSILHFAFCILHFASALFYLFAMLAKEIAIPLPALLLLLPAGRFRDRLRAVIPHAIALILYFTWRKTMIGVFLGGYGWAVTRENAAALIRSLPRQLITSMTPPQVWLGVLLGAVLLIPIVLKMRSRAFAVATIVALGAAIGPVLPVSREMQPRYAFVAWVTLAVLFAAAARGKAWLLIAGALVVAIAHRAEWRDALPLSERMSAEARFVLSGPVDATLREPKVPPAAMSELLWMRAQLGAPEGVQWFYDDLYLCAGRHAGRRVFAFIEACNCVRQVTADIASCSAVRGNAPLQADFRYAGETLFWTFGPYEQGTWKVVLADGLQAFTVPRQDAYKMGSLPGITLRVRYDSPEGWRTYSDDIALDFVHRPRYLWKR